ncbi:MAG: FAD:protein FMN transferase [Clostridium sp.]
MPDQTELDALLTQTSWEKIKLDGRVSHTGRRMYLGSWGCWKGMGCDRIADFLKEQSEVSGMILNLGGSSVMVYGQKPDSSPGKWPSQIQGIP